VPYGTEAMHVLRAEKGYIVVGQETDGTVTADDLGLSWAIGKSKSDFVGKRSLARSALAHSLVDVSHRDAALTLSGAKIAVVLSAGCPLDLHPSVFTVGMCARTLLAKAQIVLWHKGPQQFHLQASRSFAEYVWQFLEQAARDVAY
jgi:heterotetrameric sarcosine oxidase gamma subunit